MADVTLRVPAFCPLCETIMKGKSTLTYYKWGCCVLCMIQFVEGREERWNSGWRPTKEDIESYQKSLSSY